MATLEERIAQLEKDLAETKKELATTKNELADTTAKLAQTELTRAADTKKMLEVEEKVEKQGRSLDRLFRLLDEALGYLQSATMEQRPLDSIKQMLRSLRIKKLTFINVEERSVSSSSKCRHH